LSLSPIDFSGMAKALTISRTATVYSLIQLGDDDQLPPRPPSSAGLLPAPDCPVAKIAQASLPLYRFAAPDGFATKRIRSFGDIGSLVPDMDDMSRGSSDDDIVPMEGSSESGSSSQVVPQRSVLDSLLLAEWEDRAEDGLFRYDVTACPTRVLDGAYGFVAQLNEGRASKKRPTEFRVDQVDQPFDDAKFNFTKALQKEVLFQFQPGASQRTGPMFVPTAAAEESPNLVFINVSPIEYGHVLLVPRVLDNLNQLVGPDTMQLALQFAREANNPYFRVGFNSLGAYGTINHLHFQAYYLAAPMALERAPTAPLSRTDKHVAATEHNGYGMRICRLAEYPVRGLVFEAGNSLAEVATAVGNACQRLTANNIPHNLMIVDSGARVFLVPNAFAERKACNEIPEDIMDTMVDPAVFEISGHIVLKRKEDYKVADEKWAWRLLEYASFTEERFEEVVDICLG
jgi:GDP-L-galactose phosphorylase